MAYRRKIERAAESQSDENALDSIELFPRWTDKLKEAKETGKGVELGLRVQDGGKLYECIQSHTPQIGWNPSLTPALWKEVSLDEWPEWVQPLGSADAYNQGDKVSHNDKHWTSDVDANVWEPGVYGWTEVTQTA